MGCDVVNIVHLFITSSFRQWPLIGHLVLMRHFLIVSLYLCNFLIISFYSLWYIFRAAVTGFNGVSIKTFIDMFDGGKYVSVNFKTTLRRRKVDWTNWFPVFFFCCYFAENLVACIAVFLCNNIFFIISLYLVLII